jgi:hypothetical protein
MMRLVLAIAALAVLVAAPPGPAGGRGGSVRHGPGAATHALPAPDVDARREPRFRFELQRFGSDARGCRKLGNERYCY